MRSTTNSQTQILCSALLLVCLCEGVPRKHGAQTEPLGSASGEGRKSKEASASYFSPPDTGASPPSSFYVHGSDLEGWSEKKASVKRVEPDEEIRSSRDPRDHVDDAASC